MAAMKARQISKSSRSVKKNVISNGVTPFQQSVYNLCSQVPKGKVTTYGRIAKALNSSPRAGMLTFSNVLTISW